MKKNILLALLVVPFFVSADSIDGLFTHPVARVDGSVLVETDIAGFNVYVDGVAQESLGGESKYTLPASSISFTINVVPGSHVVTITTIDTKGRESSMSNEISIIAVPPPNAPVLDSAVVVIININR